MKIPAFLCTVAMLLLPGGCTTVRQSFPGEDSAQVWTALVAAAESPNYRGADARDRWMVSENHVWIDEEHSRIEIYRELDRMLHLPRTKPRREDRTWRFEVLFNPDAEPPVARFKCRSFGVPMQAVEEAERYFGDVWALLASPEGVAPLEPGGVERYEQPVETDAQERPIIDIDELEPIPPGG